MTISFGHLQKSNGRAKGRFLSPIPRNGWSICMLMSGLLATPDKSRWHGFIPPRCVGGVARSGV